jgi:hemerythrin-like metal-binding protein
MFVWDNKHCVGNAEIDRQHRHIVQLANAVEAAVRSGDGQDTIDLVVDHLVRFIKLHFQSEERLMEAIGYADLEAHRAEHALCLQRFEDFLVRIHNGAASLQDLVGYIREWLLTHMFSSDHDLVAYLQSDPDATREWAEDAESSVHP